MNNENVKQALILAGGLGSRMSREMNPLNCKSLIEIGGQSLLGHLIDSLVSVNITDFVITSNSHCDEQIHSIVESKKLLNYKIIHGPNGFRGNPYLVKDFLQDRFLLVCGHHYVTTSHVKSMLESAKVSTNVISTYDNLRYPLNKERGIVCKNGIFNRISINDSNLHNDYWYARNPYVVNKSIIQMVHNDNYQNTFSYYMFKAWESGVPMTDVLADMPPEFDYDNEFETLREFLMTKSTKF